MNFLDFKHMLGFTVLEPHKCRFVFGCVNEKFLMKGHFIEVYVRKWVLIALIPNYLRTYISSPLQ